MVSNAKGGTNVEDFRAAPRSVFLVHGRDLARRNAMVAFLNSLDLRVVTWTDAVAQCGVGSPYTGDVVLSGMAASDAVVVLLTPDDEGRTRKEFVQGFDPDDEYELKGQPRMNVILEAGMALARDRTRTIMVEIGSVRSMTDTEGVNVVRFGSGTAEKRHELASRLQTIGLAVNLAGSGWLSSGDFSVGSE